MGNGSLDSRSWRAGYISVFDKGVRIVWAVLGCGGHNKKHEQVEEKTSVRVDSFAVYNFLQYDKYIHYKEKVDIRSGGTVIRYYPQSREMEILENRAFYPLEVSMGKEY